MTARALAERPYRANREDSMSIKALFLVIVVSLAAAPAFAQDAGWIGITIGDQTDRGAVIRSVEPNSPAAKAGLKEGDVILEFNKENVAGVQQLTRLVRETPVGRTVDVKIRRDNREQTLRVTTERSPNRFDNFSIDLGNLQLPRVEVFRDRLGRAMPRIQMNTSYTQSGIQVSTLTDQLRDFFGVYGNDGVLVTSVERGSAAEKAGLKAGDVITSIDSKTIRTPAEFSRAMREARTSVALKIFRDKQERDISFQLP